MTALISILIAIAAVWALAYIGAPLAAWTIAVAVYFIGLFALGVIGWVGLLIAAVIFVPIAVLFNVTSLRRSWVTRPAFTAFKSVLPPMSDTEREALEAGSTWWETEMFRGDPDWQYLLDFKRTQLTAEERSFLDNETEQLCALLDEWEIATELKDIPPNAWDYIREHKFFAMLIPKEHGGLGFSAVAQSTVVAKIASRSLTTAVTVMVPNSLGPGELLVHYGTRAQQEKWLPGLADGSQIPCFGLTGPEVGSDASALPDTGIVCKGEYNGEQVLGMKLTFSKRWITLAPIATVIGLAFKLYDPEGLLGDPDKTEYGITCALISADEPGVEIGLRHSPGSMFMNGPLYGKDVFVPLDAIIGGVDKAGGGWRMLVECLSAGRGISLPALSSAASKMAYRMTGAFGRIRRQFKVPVGKFEGVQEASSRIAGLNYKMEAARIFTASGVDQCTPSVVTAMAKYHMTEWMRTIVNDAMDIHGGRGIQQGPRNYLSAPYLGIPIAITVEGANILTRSLMIFGQGSIRCHPFIFPEMEAAREDDLEEFDRLLWAHVGHSVNRAVRALTFGLSGSITAKSPVQGPAAQYYRQLTRFSSALAICSDITMGLLGGELKRKELISARLGDVLSELYFASATLKYFHDEGGKKADVPHMQYVLEDCLHNIENAFDGVFRNFPVPGVGGAMRVLVFPLGRHHKGPSDKLMTVLGDAMMEPSEFRDRLTRDIYLGKDANDVTGRMERTFLKLIEVEPLFDKFTKAVGTGDAIGLTVAEQLANCVDKGILTENEARQVREYDDMRYDAILTDAFTQQYLADPINHKHEDNRLDSRVA